MTVKIDPGAQVNTIPLSRYWKPVPQKVNETRFSKPNSLSPTSHTWISHDGMSKLFLGHFITEVQHATLPKLYCVCFYIFKDATSPQILISCATSQRLEILELKSPTSGTVTNRYPQCPFFPCPMQLEEDCQTCHFLWPPNRPWPAMQHSPSQGLSGLRKTTSLKVSFQESASTINGTKCKTPHPPCLSPYKPSSNMCPIPLT